MGVVTVRLIKANNLKDADYFGKTDPYVKIELEQDNMVSKSIRARHALSRYLSGRWWFSFAERRIQFDGVHALVEPEPSGS